MIEIKIYKYYINDVCNFSAWIDEFDFLVGYGLAEGLAIKDLIADFHHHVNKCNKIVSAISRPAFVTTAVDSDGVPL